MFRYQPIVEDQNLRLLFIASAGASNINYRLTNVDFATAERRKYAALSYLWGGGPVDKEILIDGQVFPMRTSLFEALLAAYEHLTHANNSGAPGCYVWADAICINQSDNAEKAIQVRQMDQVYRNTEETVIWLGHEANASDQAMSLMAWLASRNIQAKPGLLRKIHDSQLKGFKNLERSTGRQDTN